MKLLELSNPGIAVLAVVTFVFCLSSSAAAQEKEAPPRGGKVIEGVVTPGGSFCDERGWQYGYQLWI